MKATDEWDEWEPTRDLPALHQLGLDLGSEGRPVDARTVLRSWKALGGKDTDVEDPQSTVSDDGD